MISSKSRGFWRKISKSKRFLKKSDLLKRNHERHDSQSSQCLCRYLSSHSLWRGWWDPWVCCDDLWACLKSWCEISIFAESMGVTRQSSRDEGSHIRLAEGREEKWLCWDPWREVTEACDGRRGPQRGCEGSWRLVKNLRDVMKSEVSEGVLRERKLTKEV